MSEPKHSPKDGDTPRAELLKVWVPVVAFAVVGFAFTFFKLEPPPPKDLRIAAGSPQGAYYAFAEGYRSVLQREGYSLEIVETAGASENLDLLNRGDVDLALLQGGLADAESHPDLRSLGSVFLEPLWVFHRRSLEVSLLSDLRGRSLAVGAEGSGTQALVRELLEENGIHGDTGDDAETTADDGAAATPPTLLVPLGSADAIDALRSGEVDAAFFVTSARASYLPDLLDDESFALMPFRRYRAYHVRHPFLTHVVLGEGVLDLRENLPAQDVPLLAAAASLVAHRNLHHALVPLLVAAQEEVHRDGGLFEDAGTFPATRWSDLPLRKEAFHYIENGPSFLYRVLNYRTAAAVDRLKILLLPFIPLLLVVFKAAPPIYRWRIRSKIFRWYDDLRAIDRRVLDGPTPQEAAGDLEEVLQLEKEVTDVTVPLSYMDEFYDLRIHIELIKGKLTDLVGESAPPPR